MVSFLICLFLLIFGNLAYGKFLEKKFGADSTREMPLTRHEDGIDYVPMKTWKMFVIQFLNIAGLGPIFGVILGIAYGPAAFIWIVLGGIFFGAMYDYLSGMLSIRCDGWNVPTIVGTYLGKGAKTVLMVVTLFLLIATVVSFVVGPAEVLTNFTGWNYYILVGLILAYYLTASVLPIHKIIGRIYPIFGIMLLVMAVAVLSAFLIKSWSGEVQMPEISLMDSGNRHFSPEKFRLLPLLFVTLSCGALSGFHATQSPLMARCMRSELQGRRVFHAAMACESIIALIWAAAALAYCGGYDAINARLAAGTGPGVIVNEICNSWLGKVGAAIAIIGVVVCPISTGDTAMRSSRIIIADNFRISQKKIWNRLLISIPILLIVLLLSQLNFSSLWVYVGILNQTISTIMLWTISVFFRKSKEGFVFLFSAIPAVFMTFIVVDFFLVAPHANGGLFLPLEVGNIAGATIALLSFVFFLVRTRKK